VCGLELEGLAGGEGGGRRCCAARRRRLPGVGEGGKGGRFCALSATSAGLPAILTCIAAAEKSSFRITCESQTMQRNGLMISAI